MAINTPEDIDYEQGLLDIPQVSLPQNICSLDCRYPSGNVLWDKQFEGSYSGIKSLGHYLECRDIFYLHHQTSAVTASEDKNSSQCFYYSTY